ncbi:MAG: prolyl oligopeptidase family serine peptidase [Chloroflexota bacterium]|nr:prolyl oligopeptidase family serine peptidase [Chloroflexota bacterium]
MAVSQSPPARREDVVDTLHGVAVPDPYRWLEDGESAEVRAWTAAQNARTEEILGGVPGRAALEARLRELFLVGTVSSPVVRGARCFFLKRTGDQNQPILYVRDGLEGEERVLVDPNSASAEGLMALDWWYPSPDGGLVAYGTSRNGDEWSTLRVVEVETGDHRPDVIERTRYCSLAWLPDGAAFFYTRYPEPGSVPAGEEHYHSHAFFHRLGDDPASDPKVFGEGRSPQDVITLTISDDGRWLVATAMQGWSRSEVYVQALTDGDCGGTWTPVVEGVDALFTDAHLVNDRLLLRTNLDAPNYRVVSVDLGARDTVMAGPETWTTVVAERDDRVIEDVVVAGEGLAIHEREAVVSRLRRYDLDGRRTGDLDLPGLGSVAALDGERGNPLLAVGYTDFVTPASAFVFDLGSGSRQPLAPHPPAPGFDPAQVEVRQVHYPSKDGTPIPMFLVHRRDMTQDGSNPTLLTAYGGFNISLGPEYRPALPAWLERGGVFALPNLRGGGEFGEAWHQAGMRGNKQNVFDDFIAAAEWLVAEGYTAPERLGISGGSNGGLLVGAALTQRPDLFRAVVCKVPLLDMVRYHHFSIAKLWIPEYGSSDEPDEFAWLLAYSPYHRVVDGTTYPATLITTAEQDSRVDPLHARKMAALLQHATSMGAERPVLLRAEAQAGHGIGKPLSKRVAEAADEWGFLGSQLGLTWD